MIENTANTNIENENEGAKTAIYSSKFLMSKDLYYDFGSVVFNRTKKGFLIFLCSCVLIVLSLLGGDYDTVFIFSLFVLFLTIFTYLRTKKSIKISYEQNLISAGKESTLNHELFEDKIVSHVDELKREYFYHQITNFFETKNFILLHLKHNLYVTIEKNNLNSSVDEVKTFLMNKCSLVKKKKFINCVNDKKWALGLLIAIIVVCSIGTVAGLVLKFNNLF